MNTQKICFCGEIRKKLLATTSYLERVQIEHPKVHFLALPHLSEFQYSIYVISET